MNEEERLSIIEFIKANDSTYSYNAVNFKYYSDEDLLVLKKRLDNALKDEQKEQGNSNSE